MSKASRILDLLRRNAMTTAEVADVARFDKHSVSCAVKRLHKGKWIHIADWENANVAVWKGGAGEDAPRPDAQTVRPKPPPRQREPTGLDDLLAMYRLVPIPHEAKGRVHRLATEHDLKEESCATSE